MHTSTYTMLYDGQCRMCRSQAELVARYNDDRQIALLDLHAAVVAARFPRISVEDARRELHLVGPDGRIYRGAEAVRQILLLLPALRGLGELMRWPGAMLLARPLYALVAGNRYLLGGRVEPCPDGACALPDRESRRDQG
jgi:predicted DCC family thiol-disulfide oxidoreductase YuxK